MTRLFAIIAGGALALGVAGVAEVIHHGGANPFVANGYATGLSPQAVEPRVASRPYGLQSLSRGDE